MEQMSHLHGLVQEQLGTIFRRYPDIGEIKRSLMSLADTLEDMRQRVLKMAASLPPPDES
jgi:hypothetical protein